jgi:hypothetical protein
VKQLQVGSFLDYPPVFKEQDTICSSGKAQVVSDDECRAALGKTL